MIGFLAGSQEGACKRSTDILLGDSSLSSRTEPPVSPPGVGPRARSRRRLGDASATSTPTRSARAPRPVRLSGFSRCARGRVVDAPRLPPQERPRVGLYPRAATCEEEVRPPAAGCRASAWRRCCSSASRPQVRTTEPGTSPGGGVRLRQRTGRAPRHHLVPRVCLLLASTSPPPRLHLASTSPPPRLHLASNSPPTRLHLAAVRIRVNRERIAALG
jgi:hypothetical protein